MNNDAPFRELVPVDWFRSKVQVRFAQYKPRKYNGTLNACVDSARKLRPELRFKFYQIHKDGLVLPGLFAVAGTVLIEESNTSDASVCYYFCSESMSLG
jgi:hypothetical protein